MWLVREIHLAVQGIILCIFYTSCRNTFGQYSVAYEVMGSFVAQCTVVPYCDTISVSAQCTALIAHMSRITLLNKGNSNANGISNLGLFGSKKCGGIM
jgi:hypothetical protein